MQALFTNPSCWMLGGLMFSLSGMVWMRSKGQPSIPFYLLMLWALLLIFSLWSGSGYYFSSSALLFICLQIVLFCCGWIALEDLKPAGEQRMAVHDLSYARLGFMLGIAGGILSVLLLLHSYLFLADDRSLRDFVGTLGSMLSRQRYEGHRLGAGIMLSLCLAYTGCFAGGYLYYRQLGWRSALVLLPLLLFTVIYTSRAVFLFGLLFYFSTLLIASVDRRTNLNLPRQLFYLILAFLSLFILFAFSQAIRMNMQDADSDSLRFLKDHIKVWFSGNLSSFCIWYDSIPVQQDKSGGSMLFAGISELVSGVQREPGIYSRAFDLSGKMEFSNIYTLFRYSAEDLGWAGSSLFFLLAGMLSSWLFTRRSGLLASALLSGCIAMLLFSFVTTIWAYNANLVAWLLFIVLGLISSLKR